MKVKKAQALLTKPKKKNQIYDFYFSNYGNFCTQNNPNIRWIFIHNSKNKYRRIFFSIFPILYSTFHIFHKISTLSEGGSAYL